MDKKIVTAIIVVLALITAGWYFLTQKSGEKTGKVFHVGILSGTDAFLPMADGFKAEMTKLGYIEGKNIVYDLEKVTADPAGEQRLAKKFVADKVDLIFVFPTEPTVAVQEATKGTNIPVIFAYAGIEGAKLVNSVREPGGNMTGVRFPGPEQMGKRLELIHQMVPTAKRIGIAYDKNYPNTAPALGALRPLAVSLGLTLVEMPVTRVEELASVLGNARMDAMILMPDIVNHSPPGWAVIKKFVTDNKLPLGGSFPNTVMEGAIFGNANDPVKVGALAAPIADKVFAGINIGTIPVVTPEQSLWINYKRATELGLTVPQDLLNRADKIIR